jgi:uncharacterized membrane protein YjgN (DUF898 family)
MSTKELSRAKSQSFNTFGRRDMYSKNTNATTDFSLQFTGKAGEFFKIWIVNIALSIITLGIYSAWAKVRTRRYLYSNTLLMNSPFDYLGDPIKILKGRLIAVVLLVLYSFSLSISPMLQGVLVLLFLPFLPLIIIKSLSFNAYNTAYHNIRFNFKGRYLQALKVFLLVPMLIGLSFGLAYPYFTYKKKKFVVGNMAYGTCPFEFKATDGQFYMVYIKAVGIILLLAFLSYYLIPSIDIKSLANDNTATPFFIMIAVYFVLILVYTYLYTAITNLVISKTELAGYRFSGHLEVGYMLWLAFSSILAVVFSVGLMIPWAIIRITRYRISAITVHVNNDPHEFIAAEAQKVQAIGEEIGDIFDIDIGL